VELTINDIESLLPAVFYSVYNPGCQRQPPPRQHGSSINGTKTILTFDLKKPIIVCLCFLVRMLDLGLLLLTKFICLIIFFIDSANALFSSVKYHHWCRLAFNAFTCGLMLGTFIYHLIPHVRYFKIRRRIFLFFYTFKIYEVPNEDFNYTYLIRATVVFVSVYLFFIVDKLLRFRFNVDEVKC
jgi:hypothetical protein